MATETHLGTARHRPPTPAVVSRCTRSALAVVLAAVFALPSVHARPLAIEDCLEQPWAGALVVIPPDPAIEVGGEGLAPGDRLLALSPDGQCVGASEWDGQGTALSVSADDPMTLAVDGLRDGEPVEIVVWSAVTGMASRPDDVTLTFEDAFAPTGGFAADGLYIVATAGPDVTGAAVTLGDPYPNPAVHHVQIPVDVQAGADVVVEVFDALGRQVAVPVDGRLEAGRFVAPVDIAGLAAGVYVVRLRVGTEVQQRRLTVAR